MTHFGPMDESEGELRSEHGDAVRSCSQCKVATLHKVETWDSNDGAYTDHKYTCRNCGRVHWVDGIDS